MMNDPYERSAEYIDIMIADAWDTFGPALAEELGGVEAAEGTIIDLGAGSGRGVRAVCAALPDDSPVLAVEPSPCLRAVLLARIHEDTRLRRRVTVDSGDALNCPLPDRIRALLAMNMLGHLPPDQRQELWARVVPRLAPGSRILLSLAPPTAPVHVPPSLMANLTVGDLTYEGWASAEPSGDQQITWHMAYRTLRQGRPLSEVTVDYEWWVLAGPELARELAGHGLSLRPVGQADLGLYVASLASERPAIQG
ncbi:class I SAM-dependent methyltransferase [Streptomyces rugosispiralis]|uniref:Class I SAM-dependent methyltransferase n=1 Tax=Streptomyces rugosispiralis TaxID=2967341 RepID=A0ABT1V8Y5_9ACTN|nr:class I SAM-dependent methyltransferase [Streptomyces rugosispiralis]MCQ8193863.1 class I SAM-dependent methyltransferase [Streptomyces rugosispiralis]